MMLLAMTRNPDQLSQPWVGPRMFQPWEVVWFGPRIPESWGMTEALVKSPRWQCPTLPLPAEPAAQLPQLGALLMNTSILIRVKN